MRKLSFILLLMLLISCTEKVLSPISESLDKPGVVTEVVTKSIPGGVIVSYKIPDSEDLLAVKGVYKLTNGKEYEVTASYFEDQLMIQGYNDTLEHTITLYAVNRAQEMSEPVIAKFHPLESPISKAIKSVSIEPDFGGARFNWLNPDEAPLNVEFIAPDSLGRMTVSKIMTTEIDSNTYSIRGYQPKLTKFTMLISDNYDNYSDSISAEVIPMYEELLDKTHMVVMRLSNDANLTNWDSRDNFIIDGDVTTFGHSANNSLPAAITIDLGCVAKLSRFVIHQRYYEDKYYTHGNPKKMEVYACDHTPNQNGDWSEWTKIMNFEIVKPSGSLGNVTTDLDMEIAAQGHEFMLPLEQKPVRYLRFVILNTWGGTTFTHPAEFTFYGQVQN